MRQKILPSFYGLLLFLTLYLGYGNLNFNKAKELLVSDNLDQSINLLENLVSLYPFSFNYHSSLCAVYEAKGQFVEARKECLLAVKVERFNTKAYFQLALLEIKEKNIDQAESYLKTAIEKTPYQSPAYYRILAEVLMAKSRQDEAEEILKLALEKRFLLNEAYRGFQYAFDYTDISVELWKTSELLAQIWQKKGKNKEAEELFANLKKFNVSPERKYLNEDK